MIIMSPRSKSRRVDWAKYCDFKSRHSKSDLIKLCAKVPTSKLSEIFSSRDSTGLCPIHWAAVHNRSDFIEFMANHGCSLRVKCRNRLFADGTALHLAAMNGCIEATAMLLRQADKRRINQTVPKTFITLGLDSPVANNRPKSPSAEDESLVMLKERDSEGQTALMRTAAPRSKRLDIVRDLLRKNFWSLNGRPAEVALLLINKGADWRDTDSFYGLNLFHLAIMNDYDDIVNMLLVIDKDLIDISARIDLPKQQVSQGKTEHTNASDLESIDLSGKNKSPSSWSTESDSSSASSQPLISMKERINEIRLEELKPLQLAILYGRLNVISLLYRTELDRKTESRRGGGQIDNKQLRHTMWSSLWANRNELIKFIRVCLLRGLLVIDLAILTFLWVPVYLTPYLLRDDTISLYFLVLRNGAFILTLVLTTLFGYRVISKDPGHLRRNQEAYRTEMQSLLGKSAVGVGSEERDGNRSKKQPINEGKSVESRVRLLCHKCKCIRRPRTRHCNQCECCILDFDHHCIYLGCCIGRKNRLDFLILMILIALTGVYGTFIQQSSMNYYLRREIWHILGAIWISKYIVIGGVAAFFILKRACQGVTMFEFIRASRIRNLFGPKGPPDEINLSHQTYSTLENSYWRYTPDRFMTGDLPLSQMRANLAEFSRLSSPDDYLLGWLSSDSALAKSLAISDSKKYHLV